jgi:hypothetical protein
MISDDENRKEILTVLKEIRDVQKQSLDILYLVLKYF